MRHLAGLLVLLATLAGFFRALDAVAAHSAMPGTVWVLTGGAPAFARLLQANDLRVRDSWARGRLVVLAVPSTRDAVLPAGAAIVALRFSLPAFALGGCG